MEELKRLYWRLNELFMKAHELKPSTVIACCKGEGELEILKDVGMKKPIYSRIVEDGSRLEGVNGYFHALGKHPEHGPFAVVGMDAEGGKIILIKHREGTYLLHRDTKHSEEWLNFEEGSGIERKDTEIVIKNGKVYVKGKEENIPELVKMARNIGIKEVYGRLSEIDQRTNYARRRNSVIYETTGGKTVRHTTRRWILVKLPLEGEPREEHLELIRQVKEVLGKYHNQ